MDITAVGDSHDALFAEMMGSSGDTTPHHQPISLKVEKRLNKRRDSKQRPVSMTTFSSSPSHSKCSNLQQTEFSTDLGSTISLRGYGMSFPFSKPKAFFSSEQHLPEKVESYNKSREGLFRLRASEARKCRDRFRTQLQTRSVAGKRREEQLFY